MKIPLLSIALIALQHGLLAEQGTADIPLDPLDLPAVPSIRVETPAAIEVPSWGDAFQIGQVPVGTHQTAVFTIRNLGNATLILSNLQTSPPFAASFTGGAVIPAGGSGNLNVQFSPTVVGETNHSIKFSTNDPLYDTQSLEGETYNEYSINIAGSGSPDGEGIPELLIGTPKPATLASGITVTYKLQVSAPGLHRIYTTGTRDTIGELLDINNAFITYNDDPGRPAGQKSSPRTDNSGNFGFELVLQPGIYYLKVRGYDSSVIGSYQLHAELHDPRLEVSYSNQSGGNGQTLEDGGLGPDFGYVRLVQGSSVRKIHLRNIGNKDLTNISISLNGIHAADFRWFGWVPIPALRPGETYSFYLSFNPRDSGSKAANLIISYNTPQSSSFSCVLFANAVGEKNVITNGNFSVPSGSSGVGWSGSFARRNSGPTLSGGGYYFFAGSFSSRWISQQYTLTAEEKEYCRVIDTPSQTVTSYFVSADLFGYGNQRDYSLVVVTFQNRFSGLDTSVTLDSRVGRPASWPSTLIAGSAPNYKWKAGVVPPGTVAIKTEVKAYRLDGASNCDGYADNVRLEIGRSGTAARRDFEDWTKSAGLPYSESWDDSAPKGDGVSNLIKYAMGMDGSRGDVSILGPASANGQPWIRIERDNQGIWFAVDYMRRRKIGINYEVLVSDSLDPQSFRPLKGVVAWNDINADWARVSERRLIDPQITPHLFGKIGVRLDD